MLLAAASLQSERAGLVIIISRAQQDYAALRADACSLAAACCFLQAFLCRASTGAAGRRRAGSPRRSGTRMASWSRRGAAAPRVILEEREDGRGVEVLDIDPSGNAAGEMSWSATACSWSTRQMRGRLERRGPDRLAAETASS